MAKHMAKKLWISLLISSVVSIFIFDLLTLYNESYGIFGVYAWILSYFLIVVFAVRSLLKILKYTIEHQTYFSLVLLMIIAIIIVMHAFNINNGSLESTQQIGCTIEQLTKSTDKGFRQYCFIGYPTRQYLVPALPTFIFGRSYSVINMGYAIYSIVGVIIFTNGLLSFLKRKLDAERADIATALGLASFLHLFFFSHILLMFEQSIFPLALGLSAAGLTLKYCVHKKGEYLIAASIMLFHLIFAYTPALALYGLGAAIFLYFIVHQKTPRRHKLFLLFVTLASLLSMYLSLRFRTDIQLIGGEHGSEVKLQEVWAFLRDFTIHHDVIFSTWIFHILFLLVIILSIIRLRNIRKGWIGCAVMLWVIGSICFGTFSKGYATPPPSFGIHRGLVAIPALIPLMLTLFIPALKKIPTKILYVLLVIFFANGLMYHAAYVKDKDKFASRFVNFREFARYARYMKFLSYTAKSSQQAFTVNFDTETSKNFQAIDTARKYYYPNATFKLLTDNCSIENTYNMTTIYVANKEPVCKNMKFRYLGTFVFGDEKPLQTYQVTSL